MNVGLMKRDWIEEGNQVQAEQIDPVSKAPGIEQFSRLHQRSACAAT